MTCPDRPASGTTCDVLGLNMAIACDGLLLRLVKFPPRTTPAMLPFCRVNVHIVWIDASVDTSGTKSPLGSWPRSDSLPFVLKGLSLCPRNWYREMPLKSPAMPTRPNCERSRFAGGAAVKESASADNGVRRDARRTEDCIGDGGRRRREARLLNGNRIVMLDGARSSKRIRGEGIRVTSVHANDVTQKLSCRQQDHKGLEDPPAMANAKVKPNVDEWVMSR